MLRTVLKFLSLFIVLFSLCLSAVSLCCNPEKKLQSDFSAILECEELVERQGKAVEFEVEFSIIPPAHSHPSPLFLYEQLSFAELSLPVTAPREFSLADRAPPVT